jgi:hypothetical protein
MTSEPRAKICLSLQASTLRAIDALAARLHPEKPNRSATADAALRTGLSTHVVIPKGDRDA